MLKKLPLVIALGAAVGAQAVRADAPRTFPFEGVIATITLSNPEIKVPRGFESDGYITIIKKGNYSNENPYKTLEGKEAFCELHYHPSASSETKLPSKLVLKDILVSRNDLSALDELPAGEAKLSSGTQVGAPFASETLPKPIYQFQCSKPRDPTPFTDAEIAEILGVSPADVSIKAAAPESMRLGQLEAAEMFKGSFVSKEPTPFDKDGTPVSILFPSVQFKIPQSADVGTAKNIVFMRGKEPFVEEKGSAAKTREMGKAFCYLGIRPSDKHTIVIPAPFRLNHIKLYRREGKPQDSDRLEATLTTIKWKSFLPEQVAHFSCTNPGDTNPFTALDVAEILGVPGSSVKLETNDELSQPALGKSDPASDRKPANGGQ